ncbi:MAG: peptidoglycan DD-metalloendopeptidase family protein [Microscillaceae bacterium]|nr:peptidoglycan DD-metalloendopeptidase family protein [Microscillaceae bacterium]
MSSIDLIETLKKHQESFDRVVDVDFQRDNYVVFDFTAQNPELGKFDLSNVTQMNNYIFGKLAAAQAKAGVGGYDEERLVYQKSSVFDTEGGSRSVHLGIDIWMTAGTPIYAPLTAKVHSFQDNDRFGDYGPTIILEHELDGTAFYTLYGHLSRESLAGLFEGKIFNKGEKIAEIGDVEVNGHWTPHLHFQLIRDMLGKKGDFIGVASKAERLFYLNNCPNPNLILNVPGLQ